MSARFRWTLTKQATISYPETSEVLTRDPIGWDEMTLRMSRDKLYHGVFTEFTLSLKWHCNGGGKDYIDNIYNLEDINANITVLIEIDCDSTGNYTELYSGKLNLASYSTDGEYTTCNIEKSDLFTKLKARDEISVDLESDTSIGGETISTVDTKELAMHSQNILLQSGIEATQALAKTNPHPNAADTILFRGFISHDVDTRNSELESFQGWNDYDDVALNGPSASDTFLPEIYTAVDENLEYPVTLTYKANFLGEFRDAIASIQSRTVTGLTLSLYYGNDLASAAFIPLVSTGGYADGTTGHTEPFTTGGLLTGSITLQYGQKVWLGWFFSGTITTGPYVDYWNFEFDYDTALFSLEVDSTTAPTQAKSVLVHEAFNQVCDSIADADLKFYSDFYGRLDSEKITYAGDGCGSKIAVTNGLNIREFEDKGIFCSLRDLFNTFHAIHNIGLTIEEVNTIYAGMLEVVRVEPIQYFYDSTTEIIRLTGGVKVDRTNDNSRYYNNVVVGYDKWENEFKGGLDDPSTRHEYSTKVNSVKGNYNKISPYIASGYAIEFSRRKNSAIERTEDWRYDNDNFVIAVKNFYRGNLEFIEIFGLYYIIARGLSLEQVQENDTIVIGETASNNGTFTVYLVAPNPDGGITIYVNEATVNEALGVATLQNLYNPLYAPEIYEDFLDIVLPTGMLSAFSAYNLRLTPARMLQPHMKTISAGLTKIAGQVKFVNGEGNTALQTQMTAGETCPENYNNLQLLESRSFTWNDGNVSNVTPLWKPETLKFEYPLSAAQLATIRANPHGYITVIDDHSNELSGYILDMEYSLKTGRTTFELLTRYVE